ncbi:hypothetical protein DVH26_13370 [Paenibacillus sp. H1-7]|uniref:right-handed parallel beta-helix repeat-containing protein n=1 Tax=Paenibacillus sp. H1-7 TaxID=2282849 RepID=UPI001EF79280|nr:right-handed parallel beta-helix repeat-containing protein [Paenibacillus sp. H1-7]ULL15338.1 hypothetical protein DVH26_13370 [Paenibacillus sp. H1-7]
MIKSVRSSAIIAAVAALFLITLTTVIIAVQRQHAEPAAEGITPAMPAAPAPAPTTSPSQASALVLASSEKPGLYRADGTEHPLHADHPVTGKTLLAADFGADPADNGTDDTEAINAAIKAAQSGDEVLLSNGVYNLIRTLPADKTANIELKSGVNLRGESQDGVILRSYLDQPDSNTRVIKALGVDSILISHLTVSSDFKGKYPTDRTANNPDRGGPLVGIYIEDASSRGSRQITIDHVTVEKYQRMGVRISRSHDVIVRNSLFRDATDLGGGGAGYGVVMQGIPKVSRSGFENDSYFNVVENSRFKGPYIRHGVLIQYLSHNNAVRNNTFQSTALDSIDLHGEGEYLNEIHHNAISGVITGAGIGLGNTGGTPPNNHSASGPGNFIHHNTIAGSRSGITVSMGSPDTIIENNMITGSAVKNGTGVTVMNGPGTIVRNNTIRDNIADGFWGIALLSDPGDKSNNGLGAGIPDGVRITGNIVTHNTNGVKIAQGTNILVQGNDIRDNVRDNFVDQPAAK